MALSSSNLDGHRPLPLSILAGALAAANVGELRQASVSSRTCASQVLYLPADEVQQEYVDVLRVIRNGIQVVRDARVQEA